MLKTHKQTNTYKGHVNKAKMGVGSRGGGGDGWGGREWWEENGDNGT